MVQPRVDYQGRALNETVEQLLRRYPILMNTSLRSTKEYILANGKFRDALMRRANVEKDQIPKLKYRVLLKMRGRSLDDIPSTSARSQSALQLTMQSPVESAVESLKQSLMQSPIQSPGTPGVIAIESPVESPIESPAVTPIKSPVESFTEWPMESPPRQEPHARPQSRTLPQRQPEAHARLREVQLVLPKDATRAPIAFFTDKDNMFGKAFTKYIRTTILRKPQQQQKIFPHKVMGCLLDYDGYTDMQDNEEAQDSTNHNHPTISCLVDDAMSCLETALQISENESIKKCKMLQIFSMVNNK